MNEIFDKIILYTKKKLLLLLGLITIYVPFLWILNLISEPWVAFIAALLVFLPTLLKEEENNIYFSRNFILGYWSGFVLLLFTAGLLLNSINKRSLDKKDKDDCFSIITISVIDSIRQSPVEGAIVKLVHNEKEFSLDTTNEVGVMSFCNNYDFIFSKIKINKDTYIENELKLDTSKNAFFVQLVPLSYSPEANQSRYKQKLELKIGERIDYFNTFLRNDTIYFAAYVEKHLVDSNHISIYSGYSVSEGESWKVLPHKNYSLSNNDQHTDGPVVPYLLSEFAASLVIAIFEIGKELFCVVDFQSGGSRGGIKVVDTYRLNGLEYLGSSTVNGVWSYVDDSKFDINGSSIEMDILEGEYSSLINEFIYAYVDKEFIDYQTSDESDQYFKIAQKKWLSDNDNFYSQESGVVKNALLEADFIQHMRSSYPISGSKGQKIELYLMDGCLYAIDEFNMNSYILMCNWAFRDYRDQDFVRIVSRGDIVEVYFFEHKKGLPFLVKKKIIIGDKVSYKTIFTEVKEDDYLMFPDSLDF